MDALRAIARQVWPPLRTPPRPFWVMDQHGGRPRGLVAATLEELRAQAGLKQEVTLVLAEDGTAVETEGFFRMLAPHTALMALEPGQSWELPKAGPFRGHWDSGPPLTVGQGSGPGRDEVARVTVALAKARPHDLVGQLRVTAAVRGLHCDLGGLGAETLLRELLRLLAAMMRAVGQSLLSFSSAIRRLIDGTAPHRVAYDR